MNGQGKWIVWAIGLAWVLGAGAAGMAAAQSCERIELSGEVAAGQEWKAAFGQGWVFRVVPIQPAGLGYSGWDLVVDRDPGAGYPDALLLATPPYRSINEHEVGNTFGLRAQDAIGWNPRSFRFLTDVNAFREAQGIYIQMDQSGQLRNGEPARKDSPEARAVDRLMQLERQSSAGQFRIVDARIAPGIGDAAPYAENWAIASAKTQHESEAPHAGAATAKGELHGMKFTITLWLPATWKAPKQVHAEKGPCE